VRDILYGIQGSGTNLRITPACAGHTERLRLDLIDKEWIRVDFNSYSASIDKTSTTSTQTDASGQVVDVYKAVRKPYRILHYVGKEEMPKIVKIVVGGELICWRQGGELVNGIKFYSQEVLCYSDGNTASKHFKHQQACPWCLSIPA
jgi:hypothetical protein